MNEKMTCDMCGTHGCRLDDNYPDFCPTKELDDSLIEENKKIYEEDELVRKIMQTSSTVEARNYLKMTRVEETIDFIKRMDFKLIGIASCISFLPEARLFAKVLKSHGIEYRVLSCKIGAIDKGLVGIPKEDRIRPDESHESMCNPILQAKYFEEAETDFNIVMGLCVGHDTLFSMYSKAPMSTLIVKDRVTCHNPAAPLHYLDGIYSKILGNK